MRVPPDQSATLDAAAAIAASGSRFDSSRVMRVRRGTEGERLHPCARDHRTVQEAHQHSRVRLHRAADVAEHHEPARPGATVTATHASGLTLGAERGRIVRRTSGRRRARRPRVSRRERRSAPARRRSARTRRASTCSAGGVRREVAVAQHLGPAEADRDDRHRVRRIAAPGSPPSSSRPGTSSAITVVGPRGGARAGSVGTQGREPRAGSSASNRSTSSGRLHKVARAAQ